MAIRYVTLNGQIHEISTESLRGLGEWGWDISQDVIAHQASLDNLGEGVYNVLDNGILTDTNGQQTAINTLIQSLPDGATLYFPAGTYRIDVNMLGITGIVLKSNMKVVMADGCVIQAQTVNDPLVGGFTLFRVESCYNVVISGGILDGGRKTWAGAADAEACSGIDFRGSHDCYVYNTVCRNFVGDGFAFQGRDSGGLRLPGTENWNVNLIDCSAISNARTGIFFGGAMNCRVLGGEFRDQYDPLDALPQTGIHFENEKITNGGDEVPFTPWVAAAGSVSKNNTTGVVTVTKIAHGLTSGEFIETKFAPVDAPTYPFYSSTWDRPTGEDKGKLYNHVYEITKINDDSFSYVDLYSRTALGTYTNTLTATLSQINCWRNRDIIMRDTHCHHNKYGIYTVGRVHERLLVSGGSSHDNLQDGTTIRVGDSNSAVVDHFAYNNGAIGIKLGNFADMQLNAISVRGCHSYDNRGVGISADKVDYPRLEGNVVYDNGEHGIWLRNCNYAHLSNNLVYGNGKKTNNTYDNIFLVTTDNSFLTGNQVRMGSNTNQPRYALNISDAGSDATRTINNAYETGATGVVNDAGTATSSGVASA